MPAELLSSIIEKNSKSIRPNNKVNSSVIISKNTLDVAQCIANHSKESTSKILSSMLDDMSKEFIQMYRDVISQEERAIFDKVLIKTLPANFLSELFEFDRDELIKYSNLVGLQKNSSGGQFKAREDDGCLVISGLNNNGDKIEIKLNNDLIELNGDAKYKDLELYFTRIWPCQENNIRDAFNNASYVEIDGAVCWINEDTSLQNIYPSLSVPCYLNKRNIVDKKDHSLSNIKSFSKSDYGFSILLNNEKDWKLIDKDNGHWEYDGKTFIFYCGVEIHFVDEDE